MQHLLIWIYSIWIRLILRLNLHQFEFHMLWKAKNHYYAYSYFLELCWSFQPCSVLNTCNLHYMRIYRIYTNGIYQVPEIQTAHFYRIWKWQTLLVAGPSKDNQTNSWDSGSLLPPLFIDKNNWLTCSMYAQIQLLLIKHIFTRTSIKIFCLTV